MCTYCGVREYVFDRGPVKQFIDLVFSKRKTFKHIICIAHNAQGFDSQFIPKYIVERGDTRVKPSVILNGTKIILMEIMNVKFLDSLNYLHMSQGDDQGCGSWIWLKLQEVLSYNK